MKFDKAYCKELDKAITPYYARELFFDETGIYYGKKLEFKCRDENCRVELIGVNIYKEKRFKKALHYRTKPKTNHADECMFIAENKEHKNGRNDEREDGEGFKISKYPSEFLLERPKQKNNGVNIIEVEEDVDLPTKSTNGRGNDKRSTKKKSKLKTSCLEHLVDCYLNGDKNQLKREVLTIGNKTKYFNNFFKKIKFCHDEQGLIYWGVLKGIKKYGGNYKITFKDKLKIDEEYLPVSIYIKDETINNYRRKKVFRSLISDLASSDDEVTCFFVGAYPEKKEVEYNGSKFNIMEVDIENLDHIALTFK
ncbi:hypothetical protein [Vallitalea guaymasensis]|uniref:hypothetical protein n=1 Tax=Vallitalea guaymasensis TaxID=1185412 RepID=UPI002353A46E|nr:hypothetical protein [Vallitalea guaymasensis]